MQPTSDAPRPRFRPPSWLLVLLVVVVLVAGVVVVLARQGDDSGGEVGAGAGSAGSTSTSSVPAPGAPPPGSSPPTSGLSGDVPAAHRRVFEELMKQTAEIRGLPWKAPLNLRAVPHEELVRRHAAATARDLDPARVAGMEATLKLLRLFPEDASYQKMLDDVVRAGAVLGFYDPKTGELFVRADEGEFDGQVKATIVHEMTHALTDQHFRYGPRLDELDRADKADESIALSSLLEGDAKLTENLWMERYLDPLEALAAALGFGAPAEAGEVLLSMPPYFVSYLLFPYTEGLTFVESLHSAGGFAAVDGAYRRPPTSSEHIIHPSTYSAGQTPSVPPLPDVAAATGCRSVRAGTLGEFDMRQTLEAQLGAGEAQQAAQGWNGDSYRLVRCGDTLGLAQRWETDPGANPSRLADALSRWARAWSGGRGPGADGRFSGPSGAGRVVRTGSQVELVLARDLDTADRLVRVLG